MAHLVDDHSDFDEGIRALLIDKDGKPKWQHSFLKGVRLNLELTHQCLLVGPMRAIQGVLEPCSESPLTLLCVSDFLFVFRKTQLSL